MKKRLLSLGLIICMTASILAAGCQKKDSNDKDNKAGIEQNDKDDDYGENDRDRDTDYESTGVAYPLTVRDQAGRQVTFEKAAEKIVSSYYISTASLIALGVEDKVVGIEMKADTRELYKEAAPQFLSLPAVGSGKGINVEETAKLEPDLVILPLKLKDSATELETLGIKVLVVNPESQDDFEDCVELLGKATGTKTRADSLVSYYEQKMEKIENLTEDVENKPAVYLAAGSSYLSTCTSEMYQDDLIEMAGGRNVSEELTDNYWATISAEQLLNWNPDYIFSVNYAEYSLNDIMNDGTIKEVSAVKNNKVFTFPSNIEPWDYPTPSSVLGVMWLANQLHPDLYSKDEYVKEAKEFYKEFFEIDVTEEKIGL